MPELLGVQRSTIIHADVNSSKEVGHIPGVWVIEVIADVIPQSSLRGPLVLTQVRSLTVGFSAVGIAVDDGDSCVMVVFTTRIQG